MRFSSRRPSPRRGSPRPRTPDGRDAGSASCLSPGVALLGTGLPRGSAPRAWFILLDRSSPPPWASCSARSQFSAQGASVAHPLAPALCCAMWIVFTWCRPAEPGALGRTERSALGPWFGSACCAMWIVCTVLGSAFPGALAGQSVSLSASGSGTHGGVDSARSAGLAGQSVRSRPLVAAGPGRLAGRRAF